MTYLVITDRMVSCCDTLDIAIALTKQCVEHGNVTLKVINASRSEVMNNLERYA